MRDIELFKGFNVSRETFDTLKQFEQLLLKWTKAINLVAPSSLPDLWTRHIIDSAQIFHLAPKNWNTWVDLGSGGGLPGLVIGILDTERRPISLIESDARKCQFLNTVRREFDLNVVVHHGRIESVKDLSADVLSARALASLPYLLGHAVPLLNENGIALFPKGKRYKDEVDQAMKDWHFDLVEHQSKTDPESRILQISRINHRDHSSA